MVQRVGYARSYHTARTHTRARVFLVPYRCPYNVRRFEGAGGAPPLLLPPIRGHAHDTRPRTPGGAFNARSLSSARERTRRTPGVKARGRLSLSPSPPPRGVRFSAWATFPLVSPSPSSSAHLYSLERTSLVRTEEQTYLLQQLFDVLDSSRRTVSGKKVLRESRVIRERTSANF